MPSIETAINWMQARRGHVSYSMADRRGPECYDAASAVYFALRSGSLIPNGLMGDADVLRTDLAANGWKTIDELKSEAQDVEDGEEPEEVAERERGDVFIWGVTGASGGGYGHTGIFVGETNIIHCNKEADGISVDNYNAKLAEAGNPPAVIYRHTESADEDVTDYLYNTGALELLGIVEGKIIAQGWHYSEGKDTLYIAFMNAGTDEEIGRVLAEPTLRDDLTEEYPDAEGIENSGFDVTFEIPNNTTVYVKGIRTDGTNDDELIFNGVITLELAFDVETNGFARHNEKFFFEIIQDGSVVKRGKTILGTLTWTNELMLVPETDVTLPIEYREYLSGRPEMRLYINQKVFHGLVIDPIEDKENETVSFTLVHVISEWQYRQISTNLAAKNRTVNDIYSTYDFRYDGWNIDYLQDSATRVIDYVYSRQNKLDGLTKTCELTSDLFWRVGFGFGRTLEIGSFGEKKPYTLSKRPSGHSNIRILRDPQIKHIYENVINVATVYGEKSDSGMSSMSLRDVYLEPGAWDDGFPIVVLRNSATKIINNERNYNYIEFTKLAPNNDAEYSVIDTKSVEMEGDTMLEGTFSFNDLAPFNADDDSSTDASEITDEDRAKASKTAYDAAVKKLKLSRRRYMINVDTEQLPADVNVGDRIHFIYDNSLYVLDECSDYQKQILTADDWFCITSITYVFDQNGQEYNSIMLEKDLQIDRESDWQ